MAETYKVDESGGIIDPPIIQDHERRITDAQASGDDNLVHALHQKYHDERREIVDEIERADDQPTVASDLNGDDLTDANALTQQNSYEQLRVAARARGLDTSGGKIDLAARIAEKESGGGPRTDDDDTTGGGDTP